MDWLAWQLVCVILKKRASMQSMRKVSRLTSQFEEGVCGIAGVSVLCGHGGIDRSRVVAIDVEGVDSSLLGDALARGGVFAPVLALTAHL